MFSWRNKKDISIFRMKKAPYLFLCSRYTTLLPHLNTPILEFELVYPSMCLKTAEWVTVANNGDQGPGPSCSKLMMSLVNESLKFKSSDTQICWNILLKKATHIFSAKSIRILYIESAKTVNEMTFNELVKLRTLWTTGPSCSILTMSLVNLSLNFDN